jgi:urease subunit gamma/beta
MHLAPKDLDKLVLHQAGVVAQKRYARGLRLNYPEAAALLATQLLEFIRDGESVAALMDKGKQLLGFADVLEGVADLLAEVQVEGTFPDGTSTAHPSWRSTAAGCIGWPLAPRRPRPPWCPANTCWPTAT